MKKYVLFLRLLFSRRSFLQHIENGYWSRSLRYTFPESSNTLWLFSPQIVRVAAFPCTPFNDESTRILSMACEPLKERFIFIGGSCATYLGFAISNAIVLMTFRKLHIISTGDSGSSVPPLTCSEIDNKLTTTVVKSYVLRWKITTSYKKAIASNGLNTQVYGTIWKATKSIIRDSDSEGRRFDSCQAHHVFKPFEGSWAAFFISENLK